MLALKEKINTNDILTLLVDIEKDTVSDIISKLIEMKYIKSESEFIEIVSQGGIHIDGEKLYLDELDKVLINEDIVEINKKLLKINK